MPSSALLRRLALLLCGGALVIPPGVARAQWRVDHRASLSLEGAVDGNPRRLPGDGDAGADLLVYLFGAGRLSLAGPRDALRLEGEVGAKAFARVDEEDVAAGRLAAAWRHRVGRARLGLDLDYKDKRQRGLQAEADAGEAEECPTAEGLASSASGCGRRDYRSGRLAAAGALRASSDLSAQGALGVRWFEYKPAPEFTWWGPQAEAGWRWRASDRHRLSAGLDLGLRRYPDGTTYRRESGSGEAAPLVPTGDPRREWGVGARVGWSWHGPILVEATALLSRTFNDGVGLDAWRGRLELHAAGRVGPDTTLVVSATAQLAHWPEGNVLRHLQLAGDESERQNALAARLSHALTRRLSLVVKGQLYANEFATRARDALPFRRGVFQTGLRLEL